MREENGRFLVEVDPVGTACVQALLAKAGFNPFEPRDYRGWWSRQGSQAQPLAPQQIQYRGYFHDIVVDHLSKNLISKGIKAFKSKDLFGINGVLAIPDGATLLPGRSGVPLPPLDILLAHTCGPGLPICGRKLL